MTSARIRDLFGEYRDAEIVPLDNDKVVCVRVPMFGHLMFSAVPPGPPRAVIAQGPGTTPIPRDVVEVDGRFEIELLPNRSGEDRIVVVIEP